MPPKRINEMKHPCYTDGSPVQVGDEVLLDKIYNGVVSIVNDGKFKVGISVYGFTLGSSFSGLLADRSGIWVYDNEITFVGRTPDAFPTEIFESLF